MMPALPCSHCLVVMTVTAAEMQAQSATVASVQHKLVPVYSLQAERLCFLDVFGQLR